MAYFTLNTQRLGLRIYKKRQQLGLTQGAVAELTGINRKTVLSLENGIHSTRLVDILAICHVLGLNVQEVITSDLLTVTL